MSSQNRDTAFRVIQTLFLLMLTGCAAMPGMPGHVNESRSSFDNSVELSMEPALVYRKSDGFSGSDLQLALFWRSSMKPGDLVLEAYVDGAQSIATANSLHFNIDGEIVGFTSIDQLTNIELKPGVYSAVYIPSRNLSSKRYLISSQFLDRILTAMDVRVKLDLRRSYVEGIFSDTTMSAAKPAFIEFAKARAKYQ